MFIGIVKILFSVSESQPIKLQETKLGVKIWVIVFQGMYSQFVPKSIALLNMSKPQRWKIAIFHFELHKENISPEGKQKFFCKLKCQSNYIFRFGCIFCINQEACCITEKWFKIHDEKCIAHF